MGASVKAAALLKAFHDRIIAMFHREQGIYEEYAQEKSCDDAKCKAQDAESDIRACLSVPRTFAESRQGEARQHPQSSTQEEPNSHTCYGAPSASTTNLKIVKLQRAPRCVQICKAILRPAVDICHTMTADQ